MKKIIGFLAIALLCGQSCKKGCTDEGAINYDSEAKKNDGSCEYAPPAPKLIVKLKFDSTQTRLDNFGQPATMPAGNAAQSPVFHSMSTHYIELAPTKYTQLGDGEIIYFGEETTAGGSMAVDFSKAILAGNEETFVEIPLSEITPGEYKWLRASLTYQNYDIKFRASGYDLTGRLASFVGYNTYITSFNVNTQNVTLNDDKLQGYWAFETIGNVTQGQAPATTVPNPISNTSPVPAGSCVVTGDFDEDFVITGAETEDIILTLSLSTNNSFEWEDDIPNGIYEPSDGESVVDMGIRGLEMIVE